MAALTKDRDTVERNGTDFSFPVKANATIYAGAIVALDATGYAVKGQTATGLKTVGCAHERAVGGAADGDTLVRVRRGCFRYANSASGDLIARADIGADCYLVDDQTVAKTNGTNTRSVAGKIRDVDASGVWVEF